jgi:hypothetical protein
MTVSNGQLGDCYINDLRVAGGHFLILVVV